MVYLCFQQFVFLEYYLFFESQLLVLELEILNILGAKLYQDVRLGLLCVFFNKVSQ